MIAELFAKYRSWFLTGAAVLLLIFAGLGIRSCSHALKDKICKQDSSQSSPDSFW
jgi:hypothetical protein